MYYSDIIDNILRLGIFCNNLYYDSTMTIQIFSLYNHFVILYYCVYILILYNNLLLNITKNFSN